MKNAPRTREGTLANTRILPPPPAPTIAVTACPSLPALPHSKRSPGRAHSASSHPPLSQAPRRKPRLLATIPARTNTGADSRNPLDRGSVAQASCTSGQFQPTGPGSRRQAQCGPGVDLPLATCAPPNAFAGPAGTTLPRGSCGNRHARFRWLRAAQFLRVAWFLRTLRGCELGGRCWRRVGAGILAAGRAWAGLVC